MATKLPHIAHLNHIAITGMSDDDLVQTREYYIVCIVQARRQSDSDTLNAALGWLDSLVSEMRLRGTKGNDTVDTKKVTEIDRQVARAKNRLIV